MSYASIPQMEGEQMIPQGSQILGEVALMAVIATTALAEVGVRTETVTPDQLLILWCVIGGLVGSFCSLQFFHVTTRQQAAWQLGVNLGLSSMLSPLIVDLTSSWTDYPVGLRLALPIACGVGIGGQAVVAQLIPWCRKWIERRAQKISDNE